MMNNDALEFLHKNEELEDDLDVYHDLKPKRMINAYATWLCKHLLFI